MPNSLILRFCVTEDDDAAVRYVAHRGRCGDNGPVVGDAPAYKPLAVDAKGSASATARVAVPFPERGGYFVNVHALATNMGTIISCGNLAWPVSRPGNRAHRDRRRIRSLCPGDRRRHCRRAGAGPPNVMFHRVPYDWSRRKEATPLTDRIGSTSSASISGVGE